jgi:DNA-binding CsgD family transcriptional regulator
MINAFIFEELMLRSEASNSYFKAYEYYQVLAPSDKLFYTLLGIARTSPDGEMYLEIAEDVLTEVGSNRNQVLFLNTRAALESDVRKRNNIALNSLKYFDEDYAPKNQIYIYSGIALNYQLLDQLDSALFYLNLSQDLIDKNHLAPERILHYYNIKAYIESSNTLINKASETLGILFEHGKENPGVLSQAFLRRSLIMKNTGQFENAYYDVKEYAKLLRTEQATEGKYQLGLLSIQYQLQRKELQLAKVRFNWLITSTILLLTILILSFVFYISRERLKRKKREYELKFKLSNKLLYEQVEESVKEAQMPHGNHNKDDGKESKLQEFGAFFRINHPLFREKLQKAHPSLTLNDIKHCECLLAGLTVFQTARLLEVQNGTVKKARKKLRELLHCQSSNELFHYLRKIDDSDFH